MRESSFGNNGIVDLKEAAVYGNRQPIDRDDGEIGVHQTPTVTRSGVVMVGSSFREGGTPRTHNNTKGLVQAFDVKTGKRLWVFNTIPRPGEFGNDTWLNDSWAVNGNVGVWNQISVDEELGLAYLPIETPTSDFYGGHRPGNNLFADSIVARRREDRPAQVALSAGAPLAVELRRLGDTDPRGHHRGREADQGRHRMKQGANDVRVRSAYRAAGLADRRASGPER